MTTVKIKALSYVTFQKTNIETNKEITTEHTEVGDKNPPLQ